MIGLRSGRHLVEVRLGEHDTRTGRDCNSVGDLCITHVDVEIERIFVHKDYNARFKNHDIALLRLSEEVELTENIQPICLPSSSVSFDHKNLSVAGWGEICAVSKIYL